MARLFVLCSAALLLLTGCSLSQPVTESSFKGNCYQHVNGRRTACDTIPICDEYLPVMSPEFPSQAKCMEECAAVYKTQYHALTNTPCIATSQFAYEWCQRYCRSNFKP